MLKNEFAKKVCEMLEEDGGWLHSQTILQRLQLYEDHNIYRNWLGMLKNIGVLYRQGTGKYLWKLRNKEYNKSYPFATPELPAEDDKLSSTDLKYSKGDKKQYVFFGPLNPKAESFLDSHIYDTQELENARKWMLNEKLANRVRRPFASICAQLVRDGYLTTKQIAYVRSLLENHLKKHPDGTAEIEEDNSDDSSPEPEESEPELDSKVAKAIVTAIGNISKAVSGLNDRLETLEKRIEGAEAAVNATVKVLEIKPYKGDTFQLEDVILPAWFDQVRDLAMARRNILLIGPAGSGKTFTGKLVADTLGMEFDSISLTAGIGEHHLLGKEKHNISKGISTFVPGPFLRMFEGGGVFLLDEMDAADSNVLLALNTALANEYISIPNRTKHPKAERHPNFVCIGTANTFGRGANRMYAGRNQLDEASLDRFRIGTVEVDYDINVERVLCPDNDIREFFQSVRKKVEANSLRRVVSTRFLQEAYIMSQPPSNWNLEQIKRPFFVGWTKDEMSKVI